jgi:hypothetical protein
MNLAELERKLLAAARANPPSDRMPLAFEKRVIARLKQAPALDLWTQWNKALWRAAAVCVAVMVLLGTWSLANPAPAPRLPALDLSQEIENTVLAAVDQDQPSDSSW